MADGPYSDAEIDAAVAALTDPSRLHEAQDLVARAAPRLQVVLGEALAQGGWFGQAHEEQLGRAVAEEDAEQRRRSIGVLLAEETRLGMLVGVAVGFALARELERTDIERED